VRQRVIGGVLAGVILTAFALFAGLPAFAAQGPAAGTQIIVAQGPGYVVTAAGPNTPKPHTSSTSGSGGIGPASQTNYNLNQGSSGTFTGQTNENYSNGQLQDYSCIHVNDVNSFLQPANLYVYGDQQAYWTGTSPFDATDIYMTPQEQATAQCVVTSVSVPAGVSFSESNNTATLTWQEITISNNWEGNYKWDQWQLQSNGCFTNVHTDDEATFLFGSNAYALLNDVNVNI
jgi:hypothetical protein